MYISRNTLKEEIYNKKSSFFYCRPRTGKTSFVKNELLKKNSILHIDLSNVFSLKELALKIIKKSDGFYNKQTKINSDMNDFSLLKIALLYPIFESDMRLFELTLCFDNFNYIQNFDNKNNDVLKIFSDVLIKSDINTIFILNQLSSRDIFLNPNSYLYRFSDEVAFKTLTDKEVYESGNEYLKKYKLEIKLDLIKYMSKELSFNTPYMILFFKELVLSNEKNINKNLVDEAIEKVYKISKYHMKKELQILTGKKNLSDILYYVAKEENVYSQAKEKNRMLKPNVKKALNMLEDLGLIIQTVNYSDYVIRDIFLNRYILENFIKRT